MRIRNPWAEAPGRWCPAVAGGAFTIVEVLVVVAIIAALAAVAWPVTTRMVGEGRRVRCLVKLREIGVGLEGYLADHNNRYPELRMARSSADDEGAVLETVLREYVEGPEVFHCPADREVFAASGSSYLWNHTQSGRHRLQTSFFGMEDRPERVPLVLDKEAFHRKPNPVNMLYADYHISNRVKFRTAPQ